MLIKKQVDYEGELVFDTSKPNGTFQKLLDVSRLKFLGWQAKISLENETKDTWDWFLHIKL